MSEPRPNVEKVRAKELPNYIRAFFNESESSEGTAPMSIQRAESMARNPCAQDDDIGLFAAHVGSKCVGYQGLLPGRLRTAAGQTRVHWCSGGFVLPQYRNRMIAVLLTRAVQSLGCDLAVTAYSREVDMLFQRLGFQEFGPLEYLVGFVNKLDVSRLALERVRSWMPWGEPGAKEDLSVPRTPYQWSRKLFYDLWLSRAEHSAQACKLSLQPVDQLRPFTGDGPSPPYFERDTDLINWMLAYPWIASGGKDTVPEYYFRDVREFFRYYAYEMTGDQGSYRGFVVLSAQTEGNRTTVKVTDYALDKHEDASLIFYALIRLCALHKAGRIEAPMILAPWLDRLPGAGYVFRKQHRYYLGHPGTSGCFETMLGRIALRYSDGDCAFA